MNSKNEDPPTNGLKAEDSEDFRSHCHKHRWKRVFFIPLILAFVAVKSAVVMVLWNALIPDLFHGPLLDFPQSVGLVILAKLLVGFGGFGRGFGRGGGHWMHGRHRHHHWGKLSPEERQKLRETMRQRCSR